MIKFGTDGWRAIISEEFTFENVRKVAQAIADYFNAKTKKCNRAITQMAVGYDTRFLSDKYAREITEVLTANGIKVFFINKPAPTPMVCFVIKDKKLAGGVMVTASHNPPQYNGIKIKMDYAGSAESDVTLAIESLVEKNEVKKLNIDDARGKGLLELLDPSEKYIKFLRSFLDIKLLKKKRFNLLVDVMYGTGGNFIPRILENTGCRVSLLHNERNPGFGGINPEPIPQNIKEASDLMKKGGFDLGIVNDGDADRVACIRPDGEIINAGQMLSLIILHLLEGKKWKGAIAKTISNTTLLDKIAAKYNLKLYETPVGFKYISKLIREKDILAGGEESGGISVKNYMPERDGMLAGLLVLEMMAYRNKSIIQIMKAVDKEFGEFHYTRQDIHYPQELKKKLFVALKEKPFGSILDKKVAKIKDFDGIKFILSDESWLLFRLSGTEPILRVYAEAPSRKKAEALLSFGKEFALGL